MAANTKCQRNFNPLQGLRPSGNKIIWGHFWIPLCNKRYQFRARNFFGRGSKWLFFQLWSQLSQTPYGSKNIFSQTFYLKGLWVLGGFKKLNSIATLYFFEQKHGISTKKPFLTYLMGIKPDCDRYLRISKHKLSDSTLNFHV